MGLSKSVIEDITNRYYDDIYKFSVSRVQDKDAAADITHESFLALFKKADSIEDINVRAWLYKTAEFEVKAHLKKRKRAERNRSFEDCEDIEVYDELEETLSEEEFEELLNKAQKKILSILNEEEKSLFIKLYMEKKNVTVVSDELGLTKDNLYVKSHRVRKKSKEIISTIDFMLRIFFFKLN